MIRAVVADDEYSARAGIRALLAHHADVRVIAECRTAEHTRQVVRDMNPDLIFLDMELADSSGIEVLGHAPNEQAPLVVFVTAFDSYAVRAFEHQAVDYLLKPYSNARFDLALERVRTALESRSHRQFHQELVASVLTLRSAATSAETPGIAQADAAPPGERGFPERFAVRERNRVKLVATDSIDWIEADGDYARIHCGGKSLLHRVTMAELERSLNPATFVRVHRSTIVRMSRVVELRQQSAESFVAVLADGVVRPVSERGRARMAELLGGAI